MSTPVTSDDVRRLAAVARSLADHLFGPDLPCYGVLEGATCLERQRARGRHTAAQVRRQEVCDHCYAFLCAASCANTLEDRAEVLAYCEAREAAKPAAAPA